MYKLLLAIAVLLTACQLAYHAGYSAAIMQAAPHMVDNETIIIDFAGEEHLYITSAD